MHAVAACSECAEPLAARYEAAQGTRLGSERFMRYADGPTVEVEVLIDAPIERVWALVADIELPARFSTEFLGATWLDDDPMSGPGSSAATTTTRWASGRRPRS